MINLDDLKREVLDMTRPDTDELSVRVIIDYLASRGVIPQWQPIETASVNEELILWLVAKDGSWAELSIQNHSSDYSIPHYQPTHWMPLPPPPKGEK